MDSGIIPDFGPAWATAWEKAKVKVRLNSHSNLEGNVVVLTATYTLRHALSSIIMAMVATMLKYPQIAQFSLDEKVSVTTGIGWMAGRCAVRVTLNLFRGCYKL